ncbi:hypothetical protein [Dactylosporangium sp. NPDC005555]|uniref:hypothetical protein n=1 Tax=Dactylosporangium sp. NPDC005555 TaxID=3154889 RepID=UPI0033B782DB
MSRLTDPLTLFALAQFAEAAAVVAAVGVGLWSRSPSRRLAARRLIRTLRRRPGSPDR